jgi:hypothetical protein
VTAIAIFLYGPARQPFLEESLHRLYSTFPDGWPGVGLLLLRVTLGATLIVVGFAYLSQHRYLSPKLWVMCSLMLYSGVSLIAGFLTSITAVSAFVGAAGATFSWLPAPTWNLFSGNVLSFDVIAMALATILLGPGAFSIDARLFGHRKVIIPRLQRPQV